jgi:hypothetical protein
MAVLGGKIELTRHLLERVLGGRSGMGCRSCSTTALIGHHGTGDCWCAGQTEMLFATHGRRLRHR